MNSDDLPTTDLSPPAEGAPALDLAVETPPAATETLAGFAALSQSGRLSPAAETRASELLRDALLGGRIEIADALSAMVILPWPVSVNGLNAAWPGMKPYGRRLFVTGMKAGQFEGETGRRIRLSLTRGLIKVDETQSAKWACAIAQEMLGGEGSLGIRDRQSFFNVFIGKGKPWLLRLPLAGLKETDVSPFFTCAVATVFSGGCPPFTQNSLLQWILGSGKIAALDEKSTQIIAQAIRRWPGRLLRDFSKHLDQLPAPIAEAFQTRDSKKTAEAASVESVEPIETPTDETVATEQPASENPDPDPTPEAESTDDLDEDEDDEDEDDEDEGEDDEDKDEDDEDEDEDEPQARPARPVRPPYVSPGQASRPQSTQAPSRSREPAAATFDPVAALRQLDNFVRQQNQQLQQTRTALRQREDELKRFKRGGASGGRSGRGRERYSSDAVWPETAPVEDSESLRRLVSQLEETNTELRRRLEDLASDGELRAQGQANPDGTPLSERQQLCQFLSLKLGKDYADFLRLQNEPPDEVFREHYRILLANVFEILAAEGVSPIPPES